jgi:hypothetical protein
LKNIENIYNIGNFKAMQQEALSGMKPWKLHDMYENMPNFVEIQMFWRIPPPTRIHTVQEAKDLLP